MKKVKNNEPAVSRGFTLFEVLIYSAILAIFIGAAISFISSVLGMSDALLEKNEVLANQEFVERKLNWVLGSASAVAFPPANSSGTGLYVNGNVPAVYPAVFSLSGNQLTLSNGGGAAAAITSGRVKVSAFEVEHYSNSQSTSTIKVRFSLESVVFPHLKSSSSLFYVIAQ